MSILLSLLGLGGIGGGIAAWFLVPAIPMFIKPILSAIPTKVLYAALGLIALTFAFIWHGHEVKQIKAAAFAAGEAKADKDWQSAFDTMHAASNQWKANFETKTAALSDEIRNRHDQDLRDIAARADDLRVRGPGKAAFSCAGRQPDSGLPAAPGGPVSPSGNQPDSLAPVPADGGPLAVVPWPELVNRTEQADDNASEVTAWREWYARQKALHDDAVARLRADLAKAKPEFGTPPTK